MWLSFKSKDFQVLLYFPDARGLVNLASQIIVGLVEALSVGGGDLVWILSLSFSIQDTSLFLISLGGLDHQIWWGLSLILSSDNRRIVVAQRLEVSKSNWLVNLSWESVAYGRLPVDLVISTIKL